MLCYDRQVLLIITWNKLKQLMNCQVLLIGCRPNPVRPLCYKYSGKVVQKLCIRAQVNRSKFLKSKTFVAVFHILWCLKDRETFFCCHLVTLLCK